MVADYIACMGYKIEQSRMKENGAEYDASGTHQLDGRKFVAEAKAYESAIGIDVFHQFYGKTIPLILSQNYSGIFLSTSSLTAETIDFIKSLDDSVKPSTRYGVDLLDDVRAKFKMCPISEFDKELQALNLSLYSHYFLTTDNGYYDILICRELSKHNPSCFLVKTQLGVSVDDQAFLESIASGISDLSELTAIIGNASEDAKLPVLSERYISEGLVVGNEWQDYRLPAGPSFFVGRVDVVDEITRYFEQAETPKIVQIKSRSGVGKSSLVAYLHEKLPPLGIHTDAHDTRDVKSHLDIFYIIRRVAGKTQPPRDWLEAEKYLEELENSLTKPYVIFADQFESTFLNPQIFELYEEIALIIQRRGFKNIYLCLARKNDLMTTFDAKGISLDRINSISKAIELRDFEPNESWLLINGISGAFGRPIASPLKRYVLEFAQGFPWLIKRTMSHILKLVLEGSNQNTLFASSLKLDELFDEELGVLDEIEREYLYRMAPRLPADIFQLERSFDEDPNLPKVLDKLVQVRLIRLAGATYDTYNDVFKEYLIYRRLPDFKQAVLYRQSPGGVLGFLEIIKDMGSFNISRIKEITGSPEGSIYNKLAELKSLGLVKQGSGYWYVPQAVIDSTNSGYLGQYVRQKLSENALVSDLMNLILEKKSVNHSNVVDFMIARFPFTTATRKTWDGYANHMLAWMVNVKLLDAEEGSYTINQDKKSSVIQDIGNLSRIERRLRGAKTVDSDSIFIPSIQENKFREYFVALQNSKTVPKSSRSKILYMVKQLGFNPSLISTIDVEDVVARIKKLLGNSTMQVFWDTANAKGDLRDVLNNMMNLEQISNNTLDWYVKILMNWGRALGFTSQRSAGKRK